MSQQDARRPQFYLTAPTTCPYLADKLERKIFTHLPKLHASELHQLLAENGFRRSQSLVYRPSCEGCSACKSLRVLVQDFKPSQRFRRILSKNADIYGVERAAETTGSQYELFQLYLQTRHADGGMADMSESDYCFMVEDSPVDSMLVEYYQRVVGQHDKLIGVALTDRMADGLSMVYSFFDPEYASRSLGTFIVLDHIERAAEQNNPHLYLGYWVQGSRKMTYKTQFEPLQILSDESNWVQFSAKSKS